MRVPWMLSIGWGFAAILSAVAGMLAASAQFIFTPGFMQVTIIYAFAAAILGGLESPVGAVIGGLMLGVTINLLGTYFPGRSRPTCACRRRWRSCCSCSSSALPACSGERS